MPGPARIIRADGAVALMVVLSFAASALLLQFIFVPIVSAQVVDGAKHAFDLINP